jgi:uncharacterized protein (TIGR02996 family)
MNTGEALLQAVCEEPDDDGPRLVYADWLEEHGDPERAEFIRVQCRLARLPEGDAQRPQLQRREDELLRAHEQEWLRPVEPWLFSDHGPTHAFRRGFLEVMEVWTETFLASGAELLSQTPLRDVTFPSLDSRLCDQLAQWPLLLRLEGLGLGVHEQRGGGLDRLLASPYLANLRRLFVPGLASRFLEPHERRSILGCNQMRILVRESHVHRLRELSLPEHGLGNEAIEMLVSSVTVAGLTDLDLRDNGLNDRAALALAGSRHLGCVERLDVRENPLTERGLRVLRERFGQRVLAGEPGGVGEIPF